MQRSATFWNANAYVSEHKGPAIGHCLEVDPVEPTSDELLATRSYRVAIAPVVKMLAG